MPLLLVNMIPTKKAGYYMKDQPTKHSGLWNAIFCVPLNAHQVYNAAFSGKISKAHPQRR